MRLYTVHYHPYAGDAGFVPIKEGFCWPAFFLSVVWALWHRLWWVAAGIAAASVAVSVGVAVAGLEPVGETAVSLGFSVLIGALANDLRRWTLERRGYSMEGVVLGESSDAALRRFLDAMPGVAGSIRS